jgi:RHS repeat-associated protein
VIVTWQDERTSPSQARVRRRAAGSSIWAPSVVVASNGLNPSLAVRSDGRAVLAWTEAVGFDRTVWASEYDPAIGTWAPKEQISDPSPTGNTDVPLAAISTTGIVIAWKDTHDLPGGGQDDDIVAKAKSFSGAGTDSFTYAYDRLYRLTSVTGPDGNPTYGYDPLGNRTSKVEGGTTAYTYDRADRITAAGATSITLDANGNTTVRGADTLAYDQANRLTTATVAGTTETYAYDGDGTRFSRQVGGGSPIRYVSDVNRSLPVTLDDGSRKYVYGLGLAYAVSGSTIEVYHTDRLGSVRAITDATGAVIAASRTDEFGVPTATTGSSTQPFGFTGEPHDGTGLSYLRARYYDPSLGRFMSRDPLPGNPRICQTQDRYSYATNNPTRQVDPSGLKSQAVAGDSPLYAAVKCMNAAGQVILELFAAASAGISLAAFIFGGELVPGGDILLLANAAYNGYLAINNLEYVKQSILYCTGDRATVPSAGNANGPDFPLPPLPPFGPSASLPQVPIP